MGYDGTVKIGTELDDKGLKTGMQETGRTVKKRHFWKSFQKASGKECQRNLKADAKRIAEEYQKQGYNIPNSYQKSLFRHGCLQ